MSLFVKQAFAYTVLNPTAFNDIGSVVTTAIPNIYFIAGIVFFLLVVVAGFNYMMSSGDDKAIGKAQKTLTNAVIGFAIVIGSAFIIRIAETILGITIFGS